MTTDLPPLGPPTRHRSGTNVRERIVADDDGLDALDVEELRSLALDAGLPTTGKAETIRGRLRRSTASEA